jgi:RES domain-containing protein
VPVLYASLTYAGGLLELLAHASTPRRPPRDHMASLIDVPDDGGVAVLGPPYPGAWDHPDDYRTARDLAAPWLLSGQDLCLEVPSVPGTPVERNLVINARHPAFGELQLVETVGPVFDPRIWG